MIINKNLIANISNITDYDLVKDYLFIRVCNLEQNELKDMPHTAIGDLAITYHIVIKSSDTQICSADFRRRCQDVITKNDSTACADPGIHDTWNTR